MSAMIDGVVGVHAVFVRACSRGVERLGACDLMLNVVIEAHLKFFLDIN